MKQVLYTLPLLSGITLITSCGVSAQKETGNNKQQKPNIIYMGQPRLVPPTLTDWRDKVYSSPMPMQLPPPVPLPASDY